MAPNWGEPVDTLEERAAFQRDLGRLQEPIDRNLMKFKRDKFPPGKAKTLE